MPRALINDQTGSFEHISVNKRLKGVLCSYPGRRIISNRSLLQFRGHTVPDVISDILLIDEHLMHRAAGPMLTDRSTISEQMVGSEEGYVHVQSVHSYSSLVSGANWGRCTHQHCRQRSGGRQN